MKLNLTHILLFFGLITTLPVNAQTSIYTELIIPIRSSNYYVLKNGEASKIKVTVIANPNDNKTIDKLIYKFSSPKVVKSKQYRDGKLISISDFVLDTMNRKILNNVNFKYNAIGWKRTITKTVYGEKFKELQFLNFKGGINSKMIVEYNNLGFPIKITTLNNRGKLENFSTATYNYDRGTYIYKIFKSDLSIVIDKQQNFNPNYLIKKNEFGDIIEMYWPISKKGSNVIHKLKYKYDKKGNWIRIKTILITPERKKVIIIIKRKINYIN